MRPAALLAFVVLLAPLVAMVKHGDFRTCAQAAFCARQRAYSDLVDRAATANATVSVVPASVIVNQDAGTVSALLMSIEPTDVLTVRFDILAAGSAVRLRIDERDPLFPRYSGAAAAALAADPEPCPLVQESVSKDEVRIRFGKDLRSLLVIHTNPFRFEITINNVPAISFNNRNYLYFEQYRKKEDLSAIPRFATKKSGAVLPLVVDAPAEGESAPASPPEPQLTQEEIDLNALKDQLVKDMWEESFGGKTDSKPRGPASVGFDVAFPGSANVYGIPEHASSYALKTTRGPNAESTEPYRLYNLDVFEYELDNPMALYGSVPLMMAHKKGLSTAVLFLNSAEMWIDIEKNKKTVSSGSKRSEIPSIDTHWIAESGMIDLFFFLGPTQADILNTYTAITGRPTMPQQFSIAYHQCRWNYNNQDDVAGVDAGFDAHDIPYDVLWLDIEHTDGKRYFTWDKLKFPTPEKMQQSLNTKKRKMVTIIDPHIKKDDAYFVSKQAHDAGLFVHNSNGDVFDGWCWPGNSNWLDFTNPVARKFWASKFALKEYKGSTMSLYTWNDMNEPSVFSGPETTMPKDCIHHGNIEHRDVHNIYGMLLHRSTYEGHLERSGGTDRPFVLSRAFFAGTQRYGAIWTGDNFAQWDHLAASVPMILSIGMSGIPFAGADVGGFFGNPEPDLLLRWYQAAAFQPFFRGHSHIDTKRREPWLFGEPYTRLIRDAIRLRYKLLPYIYTLFAETHRTGAPIMRPMMYEFPDDETTFAMDDQFMLGRALLIKPVTNKDQTQVDVYLPKPSTWYVYETFAKVTVPSSGNKITIDTPLEIIPVFLRGGTIVPRRDRVRRSSSLSRSDPYTLIVAMDSSASSSSGSLYVDDGTSYRYRTHGEYIYTEFVMKNKKLVATPSRLASISNQSPTPDSTSSLDARVERIIVVGLSFEPKQITTVIPKTATEDEIRKTVSFKVSRAPIGAGSPASSSGAIVVTIKNPPVSVAKEWSIEFA